MFRLTRLSLWVSQLILVLKNNLLVPKERSDNFSENEPVFVTLMVKMLVFCHSWSPSSFEIVLLWLLIRVDSFILMPSYTLSYIRMLVFCSNACVSKLECLFSLPHCSCDIMTLTQVSHLYHNLWCSGANSACVSFCIRLTWSFSFSISKLGTSGYSW